MTDDRDVFAGQGFVYYETQASPDGSFLVYKGYSGGEKTPTIIEPRVVVALTGLVLLDLWNSYQNYELHFLNESTAMLVAQNTHNGRTRTAEVDFAARTFVFRDNPHTTHPLRNLREMISLH